MSATERVADSDALLRRVAAKPELWVQDGDRLRVSSAAFAPSSRDAGVSVFIRRLLDNPKNPNTVLNDHPQHGLIELYASVPRSLGLDVVHDPLPDQPAHGNLVGFPESKSRCKRIQKELAVSQYTWVCHPDGTPT